jgi:GT2 family glycosyltransferase
MLSTSLIISTYNGVQKLPRLFISISKQITSPDEIIVIIDGSTDDTYEWIKEQKVLSNIQIFVQDNQGRSCVRNLGAKLAKSELIIFVDDDMELVPECITEHLNHHMQFSDSIVSGAQIDPCDSNRSDFQCYKSQLSNKWCYDLFKHENSPLPWGLLYLTAANMSLPRELFSSLSGFDVNLTDAEDYDLAVRAFKKGIYIYYRHKAFGWHYDNVTCCSYVNRLIEYKSAHKKLLEIKYELYTSSKRLKIHHPKGIKRVIFKFFSYRFWLDIVDSGVLKIIPRHYRYRLYDVIVTANTIDKI